MSRTKKPSKLSADERAFLDRIRSLNEEETEKLTVEEMIAYWNIMHKIDEPFPTRRARPVLVSFSRIVLLVCSVLSTIASCALSRCRGIRIELEAALRDRQIRCRPHDSPSASMSF